MKPNWRLMFTNILGILILAYFVGMPVFFILREIFKKWTS